MAITTAGGSGGGGAGGAGGDGWAAAGVGGAGVLGWGPAGVGGLLRVLGGGCVGMRPWAVNCASSSLKVRNVRGPLLAAGVTAGGAAVASGLAGPAGRTGHVAG